MESFPMSTLRFALAALALALAAPGPALGQSSMELHVRLADLPPTLTLCRFGANPDLSGVDVLWQLSLDLDGDPATGGQLGVLGQDAVIQVFSLPQEVDCGPLEVPTADALGIQALLWDADSGQWVDSAVAPSLQLDFAAPGFVVGVPAGGGFLPPAPEAEFHLLALHSYQGFDGYRIAVDFTAPLGLDAAIEDPAGDVAECSDACSPAAPWYPLVDITGFASDTGGATLPGPPVRLSWMLAGLPAVFDVCRFPSAHLAVGGNADSVWSAFFDLDGNPATGSSAAGGAEAVLLVYTLPQDGTCAPSQLPAPQALAAVLGRFVDNSLEFEVLASPPVQIDDASLSVTLPRAVLPGLRAQTRVRFSTQGLYDDGEVALATDELPAVLAIGEAGEDPAGDVGNCTPPCTPAASWYPEIDLLGGAVDEPLTVFRDGFE
jgi:hypothetical protein